MGNSGWAVLGVVLLVFGCDGFDLSPIVKFDPNPTAQHGEEVSGVPAPKVVGPRLVERAVPSEPPFVGEDGVAPDGYPWKQPDKVALLNLLRLRRFDDLDRFFTVYQEAYERDYHHEDWPDDAVSAFYVADPSLEALLNAWVTHAPQSFAAYVARGNYRHKLGWHYRGNKFANKTSASQFRSMEEYFAAARVDLEKSIELRPQLLAAYTRLISLSGTLGDSRRQERYFATAVELCPLCYLPRAARIRDLTPRWGGTYAQMDAFAEQTRPLWSDNPRLRRLSGFADTDRCAVARRDDQFAAAHVYCDRALLAGDEPEALVDKARNFAKDRKFAEALPFLDRALRREPHNREALKVRLQVRLFVGDLTGAAADALNARHLSPTDPDITKRVTRLIGELRDEAEQLRIANKGAEAAERLSLALLLSPDDRDLLHRTGRIAAETDLSTESIEAQLAAAPDDFDLRIRIDAGLAASNRYADIVAMWDKFIARHPSDPRPFSERAGAQWRLQHADEAISDMQRACDLGMTKACNNAAHMRSRLGR